MSDNGKDVMKALCSPIRMPAHVEGTVQITATCGHEVWASPSTMKAMESEQYDVQPVCTDCADIAAITEVAEVPGQREEIQKAGPDVLEFFELLFGKRP